MPKAGFSIRDAATERTQDVPDQLRPVLDSVGRYISKNASNVDSAWSEESQYGLQIRVGRDEFMLAPRVARKQPDSIPKGLFSFEELKRLDIPAPAPVIEGFLHVGETVLLAGRGKVGKSRLVQQMSLDVVNAHEFLGMGVSQRRRVLIIDLENRIPSLRDRLLKMVGGQPQPDGLFVWCSSSLSDETIDCSPAGIERLRELIETTMAEVLVIDPWRLFLGKDENNAEEVVNGLKRLSALRSSQPSLAVVIVHHVRKDRSETPRNLLAEPRLWTDAVSGHHALSSHVDACYGLERQREQGKDDEELIVFGGVARNTEPRTILLSDDEETLRFVVEKSAAALDVLLTNAEKEIWAEAKRLGQFTFTHLQKTGKITNKKALSSALKKATAQGLLKREGKTYTVLPTDI